MDELTVEARVVDGAHYEELRTPTDDVLLRVADAGSIQVTEYASEDRDGPPPHTHPWHEVEYVIDGEVEFYLDGTWRRCGPGAVQVLPAGSAHSVRIPSGRARVLMVTIGAPYDGFAREMADLGEPGTFAPQALIEIAGRHGVQLAGG